MNKEIDILLARYFSGKATEKELHALDIWLSKSNENEKLFHEMTLLYQHAGQTDDFAIDTEQAWTQFKNYLGAREKGERRKEEKEKNSYSVFFNVSKVWKAAAAIAILVMGTFAAFHFINQSSKTVHLMAVETQKEFTIFENTDVTLFPGTELTFNTKSSREVQLKGKAIFSIQSKILAGIVVQAGETYIKDIGTIFTVDATTPEKFITVEVTEGEVWFFTEINSGVYLKANESAVYDVQTKQFRMIYNQTVVDEFSGEQIIMDEQNVVDEEHTVVSKKQPAETNLTPLLPELVFQNTPLYKAIDLIKTRYGVDIVISSNELNEILLNASFDNNESVEYVLEIITATISARLSKKNTTYIITP
jgi:ferric-dicitrate binding protein FerR (iron transport regulator)